jgi:hypothetical protein
MSGQSKETLRGVVRLAGEPQHKREHRGRQRVQHRASAQMIVGGLAPHQRDEPCELRGRFLLPSVSAGVHDEARRQIAAQQAVVRRSHGKVSAQQIEPFVRTEIFADREVQGRSVACRQRRGPAAVVHDMTGIAGEHQNVTGLQLQRSAGRRIFQRRGAGEHGVVRDFVGLARPLINAPWRAVIAAQVEPPAHRHHFKQAAEPVHGDLPEATKVRRWSI